MGGARATRMPYNADNKLVETIVNNTDGLLFIGGSGLLPDSAKQAYSLITDLQDDGTPYAMWGTCLGFQWLTQLITDAGTPILTSGYDSENLNLALNFTAAGKDSRLFNPKSDYTVVDLVGLLTENAVTINQHTYGVRPETMEDVEGYNVLSTNEDREGKVFVSAFEHETRPLYGTQFHPEKNTFEYGCNSKGVPVEPTKHNDAAIRHSFELSRFFGGEVAKVKGDRWQAASGVEIIYKGNKGIIENSYEEKYLFKI